jgi:hypothetical protein
VRLDWLGGAVRWAVIAAVAVAVIYGGLRLIRLGTGIRMSGEWQASDGTTIRVDGMLTKSLEIVVPCDSVGCGTGPYTVGMRTAEARIVDGQLVPPPFDPQPGDFSGELCLNTYPADTNLAVEMLDGTQRTVNPRGRGTPVLARGVEFVTSSGQVTEAPYLVGGQTAEWEPGALENMGGAYEAGVCIRYDQAQFESVGTGTVRVKAGPTASLTTVIPLSSQSENFVQRGTLRGSDQLELKLGPNNTLEVSGTRSGTLASKGI